MPREDRVNRNLIEELSSEIEATPDVIGRRLARRPISRRGGFSSGATSASGGTFDATNAEHHDLRGVLDDDHTQYVHNTRARNITARHTFKNSTPFIIDNDTLITNLNADKLDGHDESAFFRLSQNETVGGIPNFNGGENGNTAPFTVD